MGDILVNEENFNDKTIKNFLTDSIGDHPLKVIVTDGKQGYPTIIEALDAIQHRCLFHIIQNLMTPLQKHINKINNKINTIHNKIEKNKDKIKEIEANKKKYKGPIPKKDKKTRKQKEKINSLKQENKEHRKEKRILKAELKTIQNDIKRIKNIWASKTINKAKRKYNTIHNQKDLNKIIAKFLNNIEKKPRRNTKSHHRPQNTSNKQHSRKLLQNNITQKPKKNI